MRLHPLAHLLQRDRKNLTKTARSVPHGWRASRRSFNHVIHSEQIAKKNDTISDDALKDVSGGVQWVEFGGVGTIYQSGGSKVKVIDGSRCPSCSGTIGMIAFGADGALSVKCGTIILKSYRSDAVEMI